MDRSGNRAQPVSYRWETDFFRPVIFGVNDTSVPCSDTSLVHTGQAETTDDKSATPISDLQ